jgi:hypothetical protein
MVVGRRLSRNQIIQGEAIMATISTINVSTQKSSLSLQLTALVNGINTDLVGVDPIDLDGVSTKRADVLARIQALLDAITAVKSARTTLQAAVANQNTLLAGGRALRTAMKRLLQTKFGPTSPKMQDFGFTQTHKGKPDVPTKAAALTKAKATRTARGTAGKKQKALIKAPSPVATTTSPVNTAPPATKPVTA